MDYDPFQDPEFSSSMGTYLERYVDHDPLSDRSIARYRRFEAFINGSALIEEPLIPSFKHGKIVKMILPARDHVSYYWFGREKFIPIVLAETYLKSDFQFSGVAYRQIPDAIAPHGGGQFSTLLGVVPLTRSLLCVKEIHAKFLDEIVENLNQAAEDLPPWNSVLDIEREAAARRLQKRTETNGGK